MRCVAPGQQVYSALAPVNILLAPLAPPADKIPPSATIRCAAQTHHIVVALHSEGGSPFLYPKPYLPPCLPPVPCFPMISAP